MTGRSGCPMHLGGCVTVSVPVPLSQLRARPLPFHTSLVPADMSLLLGLFLLLVLLPLRVRWSRAAQDGCAGAVMT